MTLKYIQDITEDYGLQIIPEGDPEQAMNIELWHGDDWHCEAYNGNDCSPDGLLWTTGDMGAPFSCTKHFIDDNPGYEFIN